MSKPEKLYATLGVRIRFLREMKNMTQAQLAQRIGLTRTSITHIEAGEQRLMLDDISKLAAVFKISADKIVKGIW